MIRPISYLCRLAGAALAGLFCAAAAHAADLRADGPLSLIISYHATPANRAALRQQLQGEGTKQVDQWKKQGVLKDYHLLFGRYADNDNLDAVAVLAFPDYAAVARWKKIEQASPGGLPRKALALASSIQTAPADLVRSGGSGTSSADSVWMVIPYQVMIPAAEYVKYADGYVIPQMEGWIKEGVLKHYEILVDRYGAGRPWSTMLLLEYKNDAALAQREAVVARVRGRLKEDPQWKAISDDKHHIRNELQLVIADPLAAR
jgi:hypothetical protein